MVAIHANALVPTEDAVAPEKLLPFKVVSGMETAVTGGAAVHRKK